MALQPATREAYELLQEGAVAMAAISRAGLRIDTAYLDKAILDTKRQIAEAETAMRDDEVYKTWDRHFGSDMNLESPQQLGKVVFDILGHKRNPLALGDKFDEDGNRKPSNEEYAFKHVKVPFLKSYFATRKLRKALSTYLYGIKRETVNGFCHPFIDLHTAESYRSSTSKPNFANQPVRNKDMASIIRTCVIPRDGHELIEGDYSAQEVRSSIFYHHDPVFTKYVLGGADMHRETAKTVYCLTDEEIGDTDVQPGKNVRYAAKNKFVFPGFYGSYYVQMTPDLWDAIEELDLKTAQGMPMTQHLRKKGIKSRGACDPQEKPGKDTLEYRVMKAQEEFWKKFCVYDQWKREWWDLYQRQGGVNLLTGFRYEGIFRRNQILCCANQGTAFHCMLWSIINIRKEFLRRKMKSRIINQVYDSLLIDSHKRERDDVKEIVEDVAVRRVAEHWDWITVPLQVDFELAEKSWYSKTKMAA